MKISLKTKKTKQAEKLKVLEDNKAENEDNSVGKPKRLNVNEIKVKDSEDKCTEHAELLKARSSCENNISNGN